MKNFENWDKIKERNIAFWNNEIIDRCCACIKSPRNNAVFKPHDKSDLLKYWTDPQYIIERHEDEMKNIFFAGDAFPRIWVNLGPGIMAAYLGSQVELAEDTVWFSNFITDWGMDEFKFDENSKWWKITKELTSELVKAGKNKFDVSITDLSGVADIMAHMRGTAELCIDLIEQPDEVKTARDYILDKWYHCYDELYKIVSESTKGSSHWLNLWAPGKHAILQCDFCTIISPSMFEEFFLPEIQDQCKKLEYPIYHLDGPDEVKHLDSILSIPELKAVQWVPSPGQGKVEDWLPMFKKIQNAGKGLYFAVSSWYGSSPKDIEYVLQELSPKGLYLDVWCDSEEEAIWFEKKLPEWSVGK